MKLPTLACTALLALAAPAADAEPTPAIRYLLGHQPTMMDFGLLRLQGALERMIRLNEAEFSLGGQSPSVVARYDFDANQITIEFMDLLPKEPAIAAGDWEQRCRERMARVRALFRGDKASSGIGAQFNHLGWPDTNRPFTLDAELRNMTYLRMYAQFADARLECRGALVGNEVFVPAR